MKATDEQLKEQYSKTGNVWKVAEVFGMCGQVVYRRLKKLGCVNGVRILSDDEKSLIEKLYNEGFEKGDGKLDELAKRIGRTKQFICRYAKSKGLTKRDRNECESMLKRHGEITIENIRKYGHPRGMLGKHHTDECKLELSKSSKRVWSGFTRKERSEMNMKAQKTKAMKYGCVPPTVIHGSWKAGWRTIGGVKKYYRSNWEANYARYLQLLVRKGKIKSWKHEAKTFWFEKIRRGVRSYLPDFEIENNDGTIEYHEVKGWYDAKSRTKTKRMKKYYPEVKLVMIFARQYREIERKLSPYILGWE